MHDEVLVRGRLTATFAGKQVVKEDVGAHQLGVGLHLCSSDDSYHSFRTVKQEEAN
jgi:hypothetical protein